MQQITPSKSSLSHDMALRFLKTVNSILMTLPFVAAWYLHYGSRITSPYYSRGNYLIIFLFWLIYVLAGRIYDAFLVSYNRISEMVYSQSLAIFEADVLIYLVMWLLSKHLPSVLWLLTMLVMQVSLSVLWCTLTHSWYFKHFPAKKTIIIWDMRRGLKQLVDEYGLTKKFDIVATPSVRELLKDLRMLDEVETAFLIGVHSRDRNIIIKYCVEHNVDAFIIPRVGDVIMSGAHRMHMFHLPILRLGRYNPSPEFLIIKRLFDIILSLLALLILSPVMLVTAFLIHYTDGGPVFYRQCRLTKDGKPFNVLKFRSMRVDAEKDGVARISTGDHDDRITPVGRVIRKVRIDELPQLINILKGEMSIVGPRPERPEIAEQYLKELPEFNLRLQAKAGLTGYAQVYGKYNTTPYDKLLMDLMYIAKPGIAEDLRIIFATVKILFLPESTEGISAGQTTAMTQDIADNNSTTTTSCIDYDNDSN